jgi:hypothetical protein
MVGFPVRFYISWNKNKWKDNEEMRVRNSEEDKIHMEATEKSHEKQSAEPHALLRFEAGDSEVSVTSEDLF